MADELLMRKTLEQLAKEDGRYGAGALRFVYEGLGYTARKVADQPPRLPVGDRSGDQPKHVSGPTLCEGLKKLALERWGRLAMLVLNNWGIRTTRDLGEIVYLMIERKWMSAQPTDSVDDFNDVFDFKTAFKEQFEF